MNLETNIASLCDDHDDISVLLVSVPQTPRRVPQKVKRCTERPFQEELTQRTVSGGMWCRVIREKRICQALQKRPTIFPNGFCRNLVYKLL